MLRPALAELHQPLAGVRRSLRSAGERPVYQTAVTENDDLAHGTSCGAFEDNPQAGEIRSLVYGVEQSLRQG